MEILSLTHLLNGIDCVDDIIIIILCAKLGLLIDELLTTANINCIGDVIMHAMINNEGHNIWEQPFSGIGWLLAME